MDHILCSGYGDQSSNSTYIGETEYILKVRLAEHFRPTFVNSEVSTHLQTESPDYLVELEEVMILDQESKWLEWGIKEAIQTRVNHPPTLNRDGD